MFGMRWLARLDAARESRRTAAHAPGDRVVWRCRFSEGRELVYSGTFIADGPKPQVTIRVDGAPDDARVRPEHLFRRSDYMALVDRGAAPPTAWG